MSEPGEPLYCVKCGNELDGTSCKCETPGWPDLIKPNEVNYCHICSRLFTSFSHGRLSFKAVCPECLEATTRGLPIKVNTPASELTTAKIKKVNDPKNWPFMQGDYVVENARAQPYFLGEVLVVVACTKAGKGWRVFVEAANHDAQGWLDADTLTLTSCHTVDGQIKPR